MEDLLHIDGIGPSKACGVMALWNLANGLRPQCRRNGQSSTALKMSPVLLWRKCGIWKKEHFRCVLVNAKGEIITVDDVSVGELSSTVIHPREVFQAAVRKSASAVIFIHNHPSGDPTPSREDIQTTERLIDAGRLLGIRVLDHVIIGNGRFESLGAMGLI